MAEEAPISKIQLSVIEKSLDKLFAKLGIDVEFSKHFFDRINDPRNGKQITISELINIYHSLYDKFGVKLSKTDDEIEELVKSLSTDINIPLHIGYDRKKKMVELTAKTIMRKKNFQSSSKVLAVESFKTYLERESLDEALITFNKKAYPKFGQVVILAGGAGCFDGDTLVKTHEGYKQIKDITTDDIVVSFNEETQTTENNKVTRLFKYDECPSPLVELEFDNGQKITCTDNHKFYIEGKWIEAKDLLIEDPLPYSNLKLIKRTYLDQTSEVYDIEVENNHNYYVTNDDVLVHNSGKGFIQSKLLGIEGRVVNVDDVKSWVMKSVQLTGKIKELTGFDLKTASLKNPADVSKLHDIVSGMKIADNIEKSLFTSIATSDPDRKPNIIFDVTLKDLDKLDRIARNVIPLGYDKKNIHIVWIVNQFEKAKEQNLTRDRSVSDAIMVSTHKGAAMTMHDLIYSNGINVQTYMDGDIWVAFNLAGKDATLTKSQFGGAFIEKGANYVKVKETGKKPNIDDAISKKIASYVPDTGAWKK